MTDVHDSGGCRTAVGVGLEIGLFLAENGIDRNLRAAFAPFAVRELMT